MQLQLNRLNVISQDTNKDFRIYLKNGMENYIYHDYTSSLLSPHKTGHMVNIITLLALSSGLPGGKLMIHWGLMWLSW